MKGGREEVRLEAMQMTVVFLLLLFCQQMGWCMDLLVIPMCFFCVLHYAYRLDNEK